MSSRDTTNILRQKRDSRGTEFNPHNDRRSRRFGRSEININEDVIMALEGAYENQRARQVTEWETIGRLTFRQAA
jgi:hypothetical protein